MYSICRYMIAADRTKCAVALAQIVFGLRRCGRSAAQSVKRERRLPVCDRDLRSPLHFLKGAHLDLPHALARDAELGRQILEREWVLREPARLEDAPLSLGEHRERLAKRLPTVLR